MGSACATAGVPPVGAAPGIRAEVEDGAHIIGDVEIADGARVEAGAYIRGPAVIGPGTEVRHGAYLRGNVLTGDGCVIGHASECKTAILLDRAKAPHFALDGLSERLAARHDPGRLGGSGGGA